MPTLAEILADPHWLLVGFNPRERRLHFLHVDAATIERCVFLDQRVLDFSKTHAFALGEVHSMLPAPRDRAPPALVLHTAFCCSTLLARCLVLPGRAQVLRELTVYAGLPVAREQLDPDAWRALIECVGWLSSRSFDAATRAVNKPTNLALPAASDLLATHADARAVLIWSDLPSFLVSNSKRGAAARPQLLAMYRALDPPLAFAAAHTTIETLDHLQLAALIWRFQMQEIAAIDVAQVAKLRVLDAEDFLAAPAPITIAAQRWLGIEPDPAATRARLAIELGRHAKGGDIAFDPQRRRHEEQVALQYFGAHVEAAIAWSDSVFGPWRAALPAHARLS